MQQPALLAGHVTLPSNQPLNVGVAHVMRQPSTNNSLSKKTKQHQMSTRYGTHQINTTYIQYSIYIYKLYSKMAVGEYFYVRSTKMYKDVAVSSC